MLIYCSKALKLHYHIHSGKIYIIQCYIDKTHCQKAQPAIIYTMSMVGVLILPWNAWARQKVCREGGKVRIWHAVPPDS